MRLIGEAMKTLAALFVMLWLLIGCAAPAANGLVAFNGICGMVPMQHAEGVTYVRMICQEGGQ